MLLGGFYTCFYYVIAHLRAREHAITLWAAAAENAQKPNLTSPNASKKTLLCTSRRSASV
jgi:hypothetical protein